MRRWLMLGALAVVACSSEAAVPSIDREPLLVIERDSWCFAMTTSVADFDGDGERELAVLAPVCRDTYEPLQPSVIELRVEIFDGLLETEPVKTVVLELPEPFDAFSGDVASFRLRAARLDGDGSTSLVVANSFSNDLWVVSRPLGEARVDYHPQWPFGWSFADVNTDGRDEVVGDAYAQVGIFDWNGGEPELRARIPGSLATTLDGDGDGRDDLVIWDTGGTYLYRGCTATVDCITKTPGELLSPEEVTVLGDLDGDGRLDFFESDDWFGRNIHLSGDQSDSPALSLYPRASEYRLWVVGAGDLTGDGDADLLMLADRALHLITGPELSPRASYSWRATAPFYVSRARMWRDVDGDDILDLLVIERSSSATRLLVVGGGAPPADHDGVTFLDDLSCEMPRGDGPDLGVDADLIRATLARGTRDFAADSCEVEHGCVGAPGDRDLLQFSVAIANYGTEAAMLPSPATSPDLYELDECHGHYHVVDFAAYELISADREVVVTGRKQGYRFGDVHPYCADVPGRPLPRTAEDPSIISPGWGDIYGAGLSCQWLDITGVADGDYELRVRVNDSGIIVEDDLVPNEVSVPVTLRDGRVSPRP